MDMNTLVNDYFQKALTLSPEEGLSVLATMIDTICYSNGIKPEEYALVLYQMVKEVNEECGKIDKVIDDSKTTLS